MWMREGQYAARGMEIRADPIYTWFFVCSDVPNKRVLRRLFSQPIDFSDLAAGFFVIHYESHLDRFGSCIN
jgi:hypothetical protein